MPRSPRNLLFLSACLLALPSGTPARPQTADSAVSLTPGPEPPDVPIEWKQLVGIYGYGQDKATAIILERDERLFFQDSKGATNQIQEQKPTLWFDGGDGRTHAFTEDRDASGSVTALHHLLESYTRVDAGSDPAHFYRVRPVKPIDQLRAAALAERPRGSRPVSKAGAGRTGRSRFRLPLRYRKARTSENTGVARKLSASA